MNSTVNSKYSVFDIAEWFIWRSHRDEIENDSESMVLLKLMKFLYYAEGVSLALDNGSLFSDRIEAWQHGPAIQSVWKKYHKNSHNLPFNESEVAPLMNKIDEQDRKVLESVYQTFNVYSSWGLRELTHSETPWIKASQNGRCLNQEISRMDITEYFKEYYIEK